MRKIIFFIAICVSTIAKSQVTPQLSPYANNGPYTIVADSDMTVTPMVITYRPNVASGAPYPVFIFQLGANSFTSTAINAHSYDIYLKHLASWGYVVIIVNDAQAGIPNGTSFTVVHNWFKIKAADVSHWMNLYADITKVVVGGHSNGGVNATALLVARPTEIQGIVYFAAYPSTFFPVHNVSGYIGKVLDLAGDQDASSTPTTCNAGYNSYTSASCKVWALIGGMGHGGFGNYIYASQPVGPIGRDSATATVRHYLVSFMESQFKSISSATAQLFQTINQPNTTVEFLSSCVVTELADNFDDLKMEVFPNPCEEDLVLNFPHLNGESFLIIYNSLGQKVESFLIEANTQEKIVSLKDLPKGIYYIALQNEKIFLNSKVVKN